MTAPAIIRPKHVAEATGYRTESVRRWCLTGLLPPFDLNVSRNARGWTLETLRDHSPAVAALVEKHLARSSTA